MAICVLNSKVTNSKIMERTEQIVLHCVLKTDFIDNVVVEQTVDVEAVRPVRTACHAKPEPGLEMGHDFLIAGRPGPVDLVYDDEIEVRDRKVVQFPGQGLHGGKDVPSVLFMNSSGHNAVLALVAAKNTHEGRPGLPCNLFPVHNKEQASGLKVADGKGGSIGFARACGRDE